MNRSFDEEPSELLLDHFRCPYHRGHIEQPTCWHAERNSICGDQVRLELQIDGDRRITEAYFDGRGCAISQAAASILCEFIEGQTIESVRRLGVPEMLELLQVPLSPLRQQCGLLALRTLKAMLKSLPPQ